MGWAARPRFSSMVKALFPTPEMRHRVYYPPVSRIDAVQGDRNLVCTCAPIEEYAESLATATVGA